MKKYMLVNVRLQLDTWSNRFQIRAVVSPFDHPQPGEYQWDYQDQYQPPCKGETEQCGTSITY